MSPASSAYQKRLGAGGKKANAFLLPEISACWRNLQTFPYAISSTETKHTARHVRRLKNVPQRNKGGDSYRSVKNYILAKGATPFTVALPRELDGPATGSLETSFHENHRRLSLPARMHLSRGLRYNR
jgi:hypothetical protein